MPSPTPTSLTGMPSSVWMANTMPPLAEPSSLVSTTPVRSVASVNWRAWLSPFWPVVASTTSSTSRDVARLAGGDPPHLAQLLHEVRLGVQPAGGVAEDEVEVAGGGPLRRRRRSPRSGRRPRCRARSRLRTARPTCASCSAAAARNVSPAASTTWRPSAICCAATLPIVVVLPTPFTPTNSHTSGCPGPAASRCRSRSAPARRSFISCLRASRSWSGSVICFDLHRRPQRIEQLSRHVHADVGQEQGLLQVVPGVGVDAAAADPRERGGERGPGLGQAIAAGAVVRGRRLGAPRPRPAPARPRPRPRAPGRPRPDGAAGAWIGRDGGGSSSTPRRRCIRLTTRTPKPKTSATTIRMVRTTNSMAQPTYPAAHRRWCTSPVTARSSDQRSGVTARTAR